MTIATQPQSSQLPRDATGKLVEGVSIQNWRPRRTTVTASAWVLLTDGKPRTSIYIKNLGAAELILAPAATGYSNDPAENTCGIGIAAGGSAEPTFAGKLAIYARVVAGGADARVVVSEAF